MLVQSIRRSQAKASDALSRLVPTTSRTWNSSSRRMVLNPGHLPKQHGTAIRTISSSSPHSKKGSGSSSGSKSRAADSISAPEPNAVDFDALLSSCETKMKATLETFARELITLEARAVGRVTPALLSPVRVPSDGKDAEKVPLSDVATIGVKEGSVLVISVFDEKMVKPVEKAVTAAKIPGVIPQIAANNTVRIPMAKPTVEAREAAVKEMSKFGEASKVQIRNSRASGLKIAKSASKVVDKTSSEMKKLDTMTEKYISLLEDRLKKAQKVVQSI